MQPTSATPGSSGGAVRVEHDLLGERSVPTDALYGVQTLRALENFPISGTYVGQFPTLVAALASVKEAAALANRELGLLDEKTALAIVGAAETLRRGEHGDQFPVDMIQGGAGTSTNMNANEVIANLALESMGLERGNYTGAPSLCGPDTRAVIARARPGCTQQRTCRRCTR